MKDCDINYNIVRFIERNILKPELVDFPEIGFEVRGVSDIKIKFSPSTQENRYTFNGSMQMGIYDPASDVTLDVKAEIAGTALIVETKVDSYVGGYIKKEDYPEVKRVTFQKCDYKLPN